MFTVCKAFTATTLRAREDLGDRVTAWLREHPELEIVDKVVTQSSDSQFHMLAITVFARETPNGFEPQERGGHAKR